MSGPLARATPAVPTSFLTRTLRIHSKVGVGLSAIWLLAKLEAAISADNVHATERGYTCTSE